MGQYKNLSKIGHLDLSKMYKQSNTYLGSVPIQIKNTKNHKIQKYKNKKT